ncbi:MAG: hypothetical protein IT223_01320 [Crocinitomicaceae bacterium]|nr:hypothetical protein [Crocinitomicaceae bacterium]
MNTPKRHFFFLFLPILSVVLFSCGRKSEQAAEYNDSIIEKQMVVVQAFDFLDSMINSLSSSHDQTQYAYVNLLALERSGLLALDSIGSFQKDPSLQLAAKELFGFYITMTERDYRKLIDIKTMSHELITGDVVDTNIAITKRIREESQRAQDKFIIAQEEFGKKYNLKFQ